MPRESLRTRRDRAGVVLRTLHETYPNARTELDFATPFQLLIATLLSAQATDVSVNAATPALFARYPDAERLACARPEEVEPLIRTIGLYRTKAKHAVAAAQQLQAAHGGDVPRSLEALVKLPGVGRKTANVVISNAFGVPAIAVDTHVGRLARRLGFSRSANPDVVERDLQQLFPTDQWVFLHHALILHGRRVCNARKPLCADCTLRSGCPSAALTR